uniref:V-type proton ATPase subunit a n=1 Tax=Ditylenchus dipsaci TaxID=166011 RepID=A0A915DXW1_9BILA
MSVLIGIAQMTFGVFLSVQNYRFFKSKIEIFTVFIPQLLFLTCIFIYLCLQIILKWVFFWVVPATIFGQVYPGSHCAPSLLIGLINMFMFKERPAGFIQANGTITEGGKTTYKEIDAYPGQSMIEAFLVITALLCVPVMLFGKPLYILMQQRKAKKAVSDNMSVRINMQTDETEVMRNGNGMNNKLDGEDGHEAGGGGHGGGGHHDESFGDIMVHQSIHTIEYVLGCVSHTASYLRLWALSLAHAQLSEVLCLCAFLYFWGDDLFRAGSNGRTLGVFARLRLHWVEFQSKFYQGLGYAFAPSPLGMCFKS